jgi:antitoxin YqcF
MSKASESNRQIAKYVASVFGGTPSVTRYWDDARKSSIPLLCAEDAPQSGTRSYSTVGLSDYPLLRNGKDTGIRVELVSACGTNHPHLDNALATAAFCILNSKWFCVPGVVFPDVLAMYSSTKAMQHMLFVAPFLWEGGPQGLEVGKQHVAWLQGVPISHQERRFAEEHGAEELKKRFLQEQIDVFDLARKSVV